MPRGRALAVLDEELLFEAEIRPPTADAIDAAAADGDADKEDAPDCAAPPRWW